MVSDRHALMYELKSNIVLSYRSIASKIQTGWVDRADSNDTVALCLVEQYVVAAEYAVYDTICCQQCVGVSLFSPNGVGIQECGGPCLMICKYVIPARAASIVEPRRSPSQHS